MRKRLFVLAIVALFTFGGFTVSMAAKPIDFKISYSSSPDTPQGNAINNEFKKFIEEKSGGRYTVSSYPLGSIGGFDTVYQRLQMGTIDFSIESTANYSAFIPELAIFDLPFLFPSSAKIDQFMDSEAGQAVLDIVAEKAKGIIPFFYCNNGFRYFCNRGEPWTTLADMQGKKNRTTASKFHVAQINALGMHATPMTGSEIMAGLQQGVIDSADGEFIGNIQVRMLDVAPKMLELNHIPVLYIGAASKRWWDKLNDEDKAMFQEGFKLLDQTIRRNLVEQTERLRKEVLDQGHTITKLSPEDQARAVELTRPVWDSVTDSQREMLKIVTDEIAR